MKILNPFSIYSHNPSILIGPKSSMKDEPDDTVTVHLGLPEKTLSWLAGSTVSRNNLCVDEFNCYGTRAVSWRSSVSELLQEL
jgi:hypothetical protein